MPQDDSKNKDPLHFFSHYFTDESAHETSNWVEVIQGVLTENNLIIKDVADKYGNLGIAALGGFYAEAHQTATFNVDAAINQTAESAVRVDSTANASPDIDTSWGRKFSLKFYRDAKASLYQQSKAEHGDSTGLPKYKDMERLVPADQIDEAKIIAEQRANQVSATNPALAERYRETLNHLTDRIVSPEGAESKPLEKDEANKWALDAKNGRIKDLQYEDSVTEDHCLVEIGKAAGTAALVNASILAAPVVIGSLDRLLKEPGFGGEEYFKELKKWSAEKGIPTSFDTFVKSALAGTLSLANKSGWLEGPLEGCHPSIYSGIAITAVEAAKKFLLCANKQCTGEEATEHIFKAGLKTSSTLAGKVLGQTIIPIPIIGGIIGAMIASHVIARGVDSVENSTAITLLREIDKHYEANKECLKMMFESSANYVEVFEGYRQIIQKRVAIKVDHREMAVETANMIDEQHAIVDENKDVIEEVTKRQSLFSEINRRMSLE